MKKGFENGVELNDGICKTANLEITGEYTAIVILTEGRYHQIKRMFGCFGAKVVNLNRIAMGGLKLPNDLNLGESRELSKQEIELFKNKCNRLYFNTGNILFWINSRRTFYNKQYDAI